MKSKIIFFVSAISLYGTESFDSYRQNISDEYRDYYQKEKKAFESFNQTVDGIPNKVNPYQRIDILPPKSVQVETIIPEKLVEKIRVIPQQKILEKEKNTLPEGTPSGSQIKTVDVKNIDVTKLIAPVEIAKTPSIVTPKMMQLSFFGASFPIEQNAIGFIKVLNVNQTPSELAEEISQSNGALNKRLRLICDEYRLNDWDKVLLVQALMNTLYKADEQKLKTIHAVDILRSFGYQVLLGEGEGNKLYFLMPSKQQIYSKSYIERDGNKFYLFAIDAHPRADFKTSINFYRSSEDTKGIALDMTMHKDPKIGSNPKHVLLKWNFEKKNYSMTVSVNQELTALMDMYPQSGCDVYMQSRSGNDLIHLIATNLKRDISDNHLNNEQSVAFILRFSQQAFSYKTDFDAYGFERPLFVEQTILLPYSDCEDRAILLSQIYREALGIQSIGLQYPGHISLGVAFEGKGDYYEAAGQKYYVTDGTYFYASPGVSQPSFKNVPAKYLKTR